MAYEFITESKKLPYLPRLQGRPILKAEVHPDYSLAPPQHLKDTVEDLWFQFDNAGSSSAIITEIWRKWAVVPMGKLPEPIDFEAPVPNRLKKQCHFPVQAHGTSTAIRARVTDAEWGLPKIEYGNAVFFYGAAKLMREDSFSWLAGFMLTFDLGRWHCAMPHEDFDRYIFQRPIQSS